MKPRNNWDTKDLERVFSSSPPARVKPTTTGPVGSGGGSGGQKTKIIGGAVGGILGFLLLVVIIWFVRSRKKTRTPDSHQAKSQPDIRQPQPQELDVDGQYYPSPIPELHSPVIYEVPTGYEYYVGR